MLGLLNCCTKFNGGASKLGECERAHALTQRLKSPRKCRNISDGGGQQQLLPHLPQGAASALCLLTFTLRCSFRRERSQGLKHQVER